MRVFVGLDWRRYVDTCEICAGFEYEILEDTKVFYTEEKALEWRDKLKADDWKWREIEEKGVE